MSDIFGDLRSLVHTPSAIHDHLDEVVWVALGASGEVLREQLLPYLTHHTRGLLADNGAPLAAILRWIVQGWPALLQHIDGVQSGARDGCLTAQDARRWCAGLSWLLGQPGQRRSCVMIAPGVGKRTYLRFNEGPGFKEGRVLCFRDLSAILGPMERFDWVGLYRDDTRCAWPRLGDFR